MKAGTLIPIVSEGQGQGHVGSLFFWAKTKNGQESRKVMASDFHNFGLDL